MTIRNKVNGEKTIDLEKIDYFGFVLPKLARAFYFK
jgi:hypothetical protein